MKAGTIVISAAATILAATSVSAVKIARDHGHARANNLATRELVSRQDLIAPYTQFTDIQLNIFNWDPATCVSGTWAGSCAGYFDPAAHAGLLPVSLSTAVIGTNGSPGHAAFCGKTITIKGPAGETQAVIAGLAGDAIIDACLPLPSAIGFQWTEGTFPGHQPVQWKVNA